MSTVANVLNSRNFLSVLFALGGLGCLAFVVLYAWRSYGWWRTDTGRNLMTFMAVLLGVLALVITSRWIGPFPRWVWSAGLGLLDAAIWWRVIILWRRQHERIAS